MAEFFAIAPVLAFAAFALGCVFAIRSMLQDMAKMFRQIAEEPVLSSVEHYPAERREPRRMTAGAEIVELPRRAAAIRPNSCAHLPAAA
ncbi:hypothetical protein [Croceicoccus marinus]|jgi:hypothetical protein|uniref:Uncharacterized protein n=1 Tax=Croceicoccus marinus TaxID=450378 RepID=A0A7G6VXG0_9SPHN|nr:hypothetical protein [Croceicoccus marinus]QNE06425.1 hypothetical protein H4O24_07510 [Croceicoccus marinus]